MTTYWAPWPMGYEIMIGTVGTGYYFPRATRVAEVWWCVSVCVVVSHPDRGLASSFGVNHRPSNLGSLIVCVLVAVTRWKPQTAWEGKTPWWMAKIIAGKKCDHKMLPINELRKCDMHHDTKSLPIPVWYPGPSKLSWNFDSAWPYIVSRRAVARQWIKS